MTHIVVDPVTRIEGHLRVEAEIDGGQVSNAWSSSTMFRGIEIILQGRDPRDAWAFTQRICGVCTTVHAIASIRAVEDAIGAKPPPNARLLRNLIIASQCIQDHVIHFYHLHALDWVDVVSALSAHYGWIIIDTPPNLGVLTQNALVAANYVLIPTPCTGLAVPAMRQLTTLIDRIKERQNTWLQIIGVLLTLKDGRTPLLKNVRRELGQIFDKGDIFKTNITNNIKIEEAPANFQSIYAYDSGCLGASLYRDWIKKEFLKKHQKLEKKKVETREAAEIAKEKEE